MQEKTLQNGKFSGFAERLKALTTNSPLPQRDIAAAVGMSGAALSRYLDGQIPKAEQLLALAEFFNVSMEWLLIGKHEDKNEGSFLMQERPSLAQMEAFRRQAERAIEDLDEVKEFLKNGPMLKKEKVNYSDPAGAMISEKPLTSPDPPNPVDQHIHGD